MPKDGVVGEITLNTRRAADGRHPPFISTVTLPATHAAWPEGTLLAAGTEPGTATAAVNANGSNIFGVLEEAAEANAAVGNVLLHGSCAAEVLHWVDGNDIKPVNENQIKALRGIGIYV